MSAPNVFLLAIDSLRADALTGRLQTPNMRAFASRGAEYLQCIATCTTTTPSFSSMLTGTYPPRHGVRGLQGYRLSSGVTTMAEAFAAAGYNTYAEATGPLLPETGVLRGFVHVRHRPAYKQPFFGWRDMILDQIADLEPPWFLLLHIWEVHRPFRSPPNFEKRWDREGYELAVEATDDYLKPIFDAIGDNTITVITGDHGEEYPDNRVEKLAYRASRKTRNVLKPHRWWPSLDARLARRTVGHGFGLYEPLVRVPLIVSGPGIAHQVVEDQVRHVDLLPTITDLCSIETPASVDGRSLRPLIEGRGLPESPAYMEAVGVKLEGSRIAGVRTPDWKLLKPGRGRPVLYKLNGAGGPNEKRSVYSRYPEVARELEGFIASVDSGDVAPDSGMTHDEEALVEKHLKDLGYL